MPRLKSANFAVTELKNSINDSVTSLTVNDASLFPSEGPFMILVHDSTPGFAGVKELMEVGSINKNTNTLSDILRGRENTPPVAHSAGARVECVWTAGTHAELEDTDNKGKAGGYASLDTTGNVPSDQLGNIEIPDMEAENVEYDNAESELDAENVQDAIDEVNADLVSHKADYTSFKTDVGSNVKLLELNFLDLLIARELENLSTEMDAGYWWDTLQDATKIQNVTGATASGGKIITTADASEVVWREHDIGFLTDKITFFMNRTKTTDIAPVDTGAVAGANKITIKAAVITIAEAVS